MDNLYILLQQHVALLEQTCANLEKNVTAVSNANAALERAAHSSDWPQASDSAECSGTTNRVARQQHPARASGPSTLAHSPTYMGRASAHTQDAHAALDAALCGIRHQPVLQGHLLSDDVVKDVQQWRKGIAQYFQHLESAGRFWRVPEEKEKLLLRSLILRKQQQAMQAAGEECRRRLSERSLSSTAGLSQCDMSPESFCRGNPKNALICAIEVCCCTSKCAQELEEAYVAGADHAELAAAAHSLAELFEARQHLLDLGWESAVGSADRIQRHSNEGTAAHNTAWCSTAGSISTSRINNAAGGAAERLQEEYAGHCAALHQIGYTWKCMAAFGNSDDIWPSSCQALPGMNWVPDDAWRMVVDSVGVDRKASPTCGPVSVAFKHCKEAKAWIAMLMQMQRLAWELHLMEVSGVQLSQAVFAMFEMPPTAESGHEQAHRFVALRALHALLLPTRSATLSAGIKSLCTQSPSPTVQDPQ